MWTDPFQAVREAVTALDAARTASELGAKHLVLYHTQDNCLPERKQLYTAEAKQVFAGPVYVPDDLETLDLAR